MTDTTRQMSDIDEETDALLEWVDQLIELPLDGSDAGERPAAIPPAVKTIIERALGQPIDSD